MLEATYDVLETRRDKNGPNKQTDIDQLQEPSKC